MCCSAGFGSRWTPSAASAIAKRDGADAFALAGLQAHRVPRPFADGFAFPLATDTMMFSTRPPAADFVSSESATLTRLTLRLLNRLSSSARSATERVSRSSLAMMTTSTAPAVDEREQPRHAGPLQALGALAGVHDDVQQLRVLHRRHRPHLLGLGLERNAAVRLLVGAHSDVADGFHTVMILNPLKLVSSIASDTSSNKSASKAAAFWSCVCLPDRVKIAAWQRNDCRPTCWRTFGSRGRRAAGLAGRGRSRP